MTMLTGNKMDDGFMVESELGLRWQDLDNKDALKKALRVKGSSETKGKVLVIKEWSVGESNLRIAQDK